jgi:cation diffusion facilitator family transporter
VNVTVLVALGANALVALAKTAAASVTGSASMVAEAAHSWADTGNEVLLLVADRRSSRKADPAHPLGYGREAYVWSMFAALGLFAAGSAVSITHGIQELLDPQPAESFFVAYLVLGVAFVLEGISFVQATRQLRHEASTLDREPLAHAMQTSDPTLRAVFAEDFAALAGIVIAFVGILLHELTGSAVPDAIGSIAVGVLLGVVALVLVDRNRAFITGVAVSAALRRAALEQLAGLPDVARVSYLHMEFVGPRRIYLVAAVDLAGDDPEQLVARRLRVLERTLEARPGVVEAVLTLAEPEAADLLASEGVRRLGEPSP